MFLARRERGRSPGGTAATGPVTVSGCPAGAYLEGERRGVAVFAPGGYHWVPQMGEELLVLKAGEDGEKPCAVGVASAVEGLEPGEVLIRAGGTSILLGRDGQVAVKGVFTVNGTMVGPPPPDDKEDE